MEVRLKLLNLARRLAGFLPEVRSPIGEIPLRQKSAYTAVSLLIFLVGSHLPLYLTGAHCTPESPAANPLYWKHGAGASNSNTVMALGVIPLLLSEAVVHLLLQRKIDRVRVNYYDPQGRMLLCGAQKLIALLIAFALPIRDVLGDSIMSTLDVILIVLQLFLGGVAIIFLDEVLKKGYGFLSGIPLFTAANICTNHFWEAFSPYIRAYGERHGDAHGAMVSSIFHHLIARGDDDSFAMHKAFSHQDLPNRAGVVATCTFFLIVLSLQGFHVSLPLRSHNQPALQANYRIRLSYLSFAPLIFQNVLVSILYSIPQLLYMKFGENNIVANLMGTWKESKYFGEAVPVSGIAYYVTRPPTLSDIGRDPVNTLLYAMLLLLGYAFLSTSTFELCAYSDQYVARLLGERRSVTLVQPNSVPQKQWRRYVAKVAFLVGLCIGALTMLASLTSVLGSGTGIMLAVTIIYSCVEWEGRRTSGAVFGL
ncbi:unnamed protein product [Urochloa decumbens]|uniref:Translocon Sec61/SecY plug domain-containing protein n=1 Tax=Urochloa decumbens TaxID=240449 RepID=A0ABC8W9R2_9POAL